MDFYRTNATQHDPDVQDSKQKAQMVVLSNQLFYFLFVSVVKHGKLNKEHSSSKQNCNMSEDFQTHQQAAARLGCLDALTERSSHRPGNNTKEKRCGDECARGTGKRRRGCAFFLKNQLKCLLTRE